jgi:hypothetical protein
VAIAVVARALDGDAISLGIEDDEAAWTFAGAGCLEA